MRVSTAHLEAELNAATEPAQEVLARVRDTDWQAWAIPLPARVFTYDAARVVPAFEAFVAASSPEQAEDAYNAFLDAVGHNHSGTPFAAMAPGARLLAQLIPHLDVGGPAGMEALTDCVCWSSDEPTFTGPDGVECDLADATAEAARELAALARNWLSSGDEAHRRAAASLLEVLAQLPK